MSIYNPLSSSINPSRFLSYKLFHITSSIPVSSSERTPTSSAQLRSGSNNIFLLSASAAYTAGLNVQTPVELTSYIYSNLTNYTDVTESMHSVELESYNTRGDTIYQNTPQYIEGPIRISTGSDASHTTGSIRIGFGRILRIKDGENFTIKLGCTNQTALNHDPSANLNDGSCINPIYGCTDSNSTNYNPAANISNNSCIYTGCTDPIALNYNLLASIENGTCQYITNGTFINTNQTTKRIDNSYSKKKIIGSNITTSLTTKGSILMRSNGKAYIGPYYISTYNSADTTFEQIYVAGSTPSNRPIQFISGDILVLRNGNRKYTDNNNPISNKLPLAYKQPTSQEQLCSNCVFYDSSKNLNCTRWEAEIRTNYWCAKYKPLNTLTSAGDTFRSEFPGIIQTGLNTSGNEFILTNKTSYSGTYRIMPDGAYFSDNTSSFKRIYLKQTLRFGPKKHFTKMNKKIARKNISKTLTQTTTTTSPTSLPTPVSTSTTSTPTTSTSGTGTSYSY